MFGGFNPGLITVPLIMEKGQQFPNGILDHFTGHAFYVLLPFYLLSAAKQFKFTSNVIVIGSGMYICKDAIQIFTSH